MSTYTIEPTEGIKLMTDCAGWFHATTDLMHLIQWIASRCNAPTLSANVKLEAVAKFLAAYFDLQTITYDMVTQ